MKILHATPVSALLLASTAMAQGVPQLTVFGIDWRSPTVGVPDSFGGVPITEGDLLLPQTLLPAIGPLLQPGITESAGAFAPFGLNLALHAASVGHPGGTPGRVEVDAISHGLDRRIERIVPGAVAPPSRYAFSVDKWSRGNFAAPAFPSVGTESTCMDAAADVFRDLGVPMVPAGPGAPIVGNQGLHDGNGLASCTAAVYPGLGLLEPGLGAVGDDLDALDGDVPDQWLPRVTRTYFSLDAAFLNPLTGVANSGSAPAHGFRGGDVLYAEPSGAIIVYAPAGALGLDLGGIGTDDLDALAICENGVAGYQRNAGLFDWMFGQTDMLLFSVRRGSAVVGQLDSLFGQPIEPGDILIPPFVAGGRPGIFVAAESLGLVTMRSGMANIADDLDALDTLHDAPKADEYCSSAATSGAPCPCGNNGAPGRGCGNSVNPLGAKLWTNGTPSISADTVIMSGSGMPASASAVLVQGTLGAPPVPFGDGLRCIAGVQTRLFTRNCLAGNIQYGWTVPGTGSIAAAGGVTVPGTRFYQIFYRNTAPFCTPAVLNTTNALAMTWVP